MTAELVVAACTGLGVAALIATAAETWPQWVAAALIGGIGVNYLILAIHALRFWARLHRGMEGHGGVSSTVLRRTGHRSMSLIIPFITLLPPRVLRAREPGRGVSSLRPLVVVTLLDFAWQVPYGLHQYGWAWTTLPRLTGLLLVALGWFLAGVLVYRRSGGHRRWLLVSFLAVEVVFYVVHYVSGAFLSDLHWDNPTVLVASLLGYLSTLVAAWYLLHMHSCDQREHDSTSHTAPMDGES